LFLNQSNIHGGVRQGPS